MSFSFGAFLIRSPLKFLQDAIEQKRFLEGVVVSVMYFERVCFQELKKYFEAKGVPLRPMKLEKQSVSKMMSMLEGFDVIPQPIHSLMGEVVELRNDIVHELRNPDEIDEKKARETIEKAIKCLIALGVT